MLQQDVFAHVCVSDKWSGLRFVIIGDCMMTVQIPSSDLHASHTFKLIRFSFFFFRIDPALLVFFCQKIGTRPEI